MQHSLRDIIDVGRIDPLYIWGCSCDGFGITRSTTEEAAAADWFIHWKDARDRATSGHQCIHGHPSCSLIPEGSCQRLVCTCETDGWCDACRGPVEEYDPYAGDEPDLADEDPEGNRRVPAVSNRELL